MVDWQALEGIGGVATAFAVLVALVLGVTQVREANRLRRQALVTGIVGQFTTEALAGAVDAVMALPDDAEPAAIRDDDVRRSAFLRLDIAIEGVGLLVYERGADLHAVDRHMGGLVRAAWPKVRRYVEEERVRTGSPSLGEWWQWLVDRMEEDPAPGKSEGAHVAFRAWRP